MNLQQQREEARRRRLINRSVVQHRQRHFDDVRRGIVGPGVAMGRVLPGPLPAVQPVPIGPAMIDSPAITSAIKSTTVAVMLGLLLQFHAPLLNALQSLLPAVAG